MSFGSGRIWMNGKLVNWPDATLHVASHVVHYGSAVFEGARCYDTPLGSACFRLDAHMRRLLDSAKVYRMQYALDREGLTAAVLETIDANALKACYIRPIIYRGYRSLGVNPLPCPVEAAIIVWQWDAYLGPDATEHGVDVCVSSWRRVAPDTFPAMAKSSANYASSALIKMEAMAENYAEAIALDTQGFVSEGSGQNVFLVRDGIVYTPPLASAVLPGITRDSIVTIARDLGYRVREQAIPREMLYLADEVFFAGTAVEVVPVRSVDRLTVGTGTKGPITAAIERRFFDIINGRVPDTHGWLRYVGAGRSAASTAARPATVS